MKFSLTLLLLAGFIAFALAAPLDDAPLEDAPLEDAPLEDAPLEDAPLEGDTEDSPEKQDVPGAEETSENNDEDDDLNEDEEADEAEDTPESDEDGDTKDTVAENVEDPRTASNHTRQSGRRRRRRRRRRRYVIKTVKVCHRHGRGYHCRGPLIRVRVPRCQFGLCRRYYSVFCYKRRLYCSRRYRRYYRRSRACIISSRCGIQRHRSCVRRCRYLGSCHRG